MINLSQAGDRTKSRGYGPSDLRTTTGWIGWILFASLMLILLGFLQAFEGLVALVDSDGER